MDINSNSCTIIYVSVMVVIMVFLPAFVGSSLKMIQNRSQELNTKKQILAVPNIRDVRDVDAEHSKYVKGDILMNVDGILAENMDGFPISYGKKAKENSRLHVFACDVDGETKYVVLVCGTGLWDIIWGHMALDADKDTVYGVYFSYVGEAPGLGVEIATIASQGEFSDEGVLKGGQVTLAVEKNGKVTDPTYQVDGISGGTIASKGVDAMIKAYLSQYNKFSINNQGGTIEYEPIIF